MHFLARISGKCLCGAAFFGTERDRIVRDLNHSRSCSLRDHVGYISLNYRRLVTNELDRKL